MQSEENLALSHFQTALDLFAAGEGMMRLKLTRSDPTMTANEVEDLLVDWLRQRPGAERGDCPGPSRAAR
ncbi:MAG: hypothetical protein IH936_00895 [Acidobacteria bacterium]|nr:hypothetical protein [Acidobacteriota bacterium]